jgi:hypothetical protein
MNIERDNNYIVSKYTDSELYDILDLVNPGDRVLEAKIIQMINRYSNIGGESGEKLTQFFKDIYDRFFYDEEGFQEEEEEEEEEGFQQQHQQQQPQQQQQQQQQEEEEEEETDKIVEGLENKPISVSKAVDYNIDESNYNQIVGPPPTPKEPVTEESKNAERLIVPVQTKEYVRSYLNPLLKQTVKRVISIDSQYRDNRDTLSTNFTFNLSESLKNVLALRLYSIQIPYTWYTISKNYGGNFFYLKGNSPGIDDGNYDYKVEIPSGNYTPDLLSSTVNTSLQTLKTLYTDVSFCNTNIAYVSGTSKVTFAMQIKNNYDETNYNLIFDNNPALSKYPTETDVCGNQLRYSNNALSTLSSYLGFNNNNYCPNAIVSGTLPSIAVTFTEDSGISRFTVDDTNNYFTINQYIGPSSFNSQAINATTTITLTNGTYNRDGIVVELNKQLSGNRYLKNSYITRVSISGNYLQDNGSSYFKMVINWNKTTTPNQNINSLKTVVVFPGETDNNSRIWTYNKELLNCFYFLNRTSELNNIISETSVNQTNYVINSNPYILLKCIAAGYTVDYTGLLDLSGALTPAGFNTFSSITSNSISYRIKNKNDYLITVPNSLGTGYSLDQYLAAINTGIVTTNDGSKDTSNLTGIFNTVNTQIYNNPLTSKISLEIDLSKSFTKHSYYIDLRGSYLYDILNVGRDVIGTTGVYGMSIDLSENSVFTGTIATNFSNYTLPTRYIAKVYPNGRLVDNSNAEPFLILPISYEALDITRFSEMITNSFRSFQDPEGSTPFSNSSFSMTITPNLEVVSTLDIKINKYLTQDNYKLILYDPISNGYPTQNSWYKNLKLTDLSYSLVNYKITNAYSKISGNDILSGYTYTIKEPTKITLKGVNPGVATSSGKNDVTITIPAAPGPNYTYTLQQIYEKINTGFAENLITNGSSISTFPIGEKNYVNIRLNINKTYTEKDYRLVFYDPFSFAKCTSGVSVTRNATWDSTLGWILGFRQKTEYDLSLRDNELIVDNATTGGTDITGDTTVSTNLYNYFLIILNDYTQSHLNDGLVTLTPQQTSISLPSYANRTTFQCDVNGKKTFTGALSNIPGNNSTQNQILSVNTTVNGNENKPKTYSKGPFVQDIFGLIPIKSGINGSTYVEFGGTLQNQERTYFGPVNLKRMNIQLITDRGDPVDLNGQNWSFSFICEQLYEQTSTY